MRVVKDALKMRFRRQQDYLEFRRLLEKLPAAAYTCNSEGLITYFNERAAQLWGRKPKLNETVDRFCGSVRLYSMDGTLIGPDECWMALALRENREYENCEVVVERPDGSRRIVSAYAHPLYDKRGRVCGAVNVLMDITDRKRDENALFERNRLIALRADVSGALALAQPMQSALQHCCEAIVRHLDVASARIWTLLAPENVLERQASAGESSHWDGSPSQVAVGQSKIGQIAQDCQPYLTNDVPHDPAFSNADGVSPEGVVAFAGYPLLVEKQLVGVVEMFAGEPLSQALLAELSPFAESIALYIDHKQAEERLREQTRITETLHRIGRLLAAELDLDKLVQAVTDEATKITEAEFGAFFYNVQNEQGESYLLYSLSGVPKEAFARFPHPRNTALFGPTFRGESPIRLDDVTQDPRYGKNDPYFGMPKGHLPVRSYLAAPVISRSGEVLGGLFFGHSQIGVFKDRQESLVVGIAAQAAIAIDNARLYRQAQKQAERLREADQRKDEILAMLAHELRNPLAPIRTGLDLLAMDRGSTHSETIQLMQQQIEHIVRLVDDLLDVSRIMRGKIELRKEPIELGVLIERSIKALRPQIEGQQHEFVVTLPEQPIWLDVDPVRFVQVIENLLTNASKYTHAGGRIELAAERQSGQVMIRVQDTGIGIEPELLPSVFELFTQSSRSLDRAQGGLGIGLTLVQRLVELHGGTVSAFSEGVGKGSTFVVRLPVGNEPLQAAKEIEQSPVAHSRRILVVDDNVAAASMLSMLLTRMGDHQVKFVHDGPSALTTIQESHPEIVLLDIGLPGMDGYEVARAVRGMPEFDDVVLIALTGYGQQEDRIRSKEAGFDEHLVKPPSVEELRNIPLHPKLLAQNRWRGSESPSAPDDVAPSGKPDRPG